jgi:hypothetical protein
MTHDPLSPKERQQKYTLPENIGDTENFLFEPELQRIISEYGGSGRSLGGCLTRVIVIKITAVYLESHIISDSPQSTSHLPSELKDIVKFKCATGVWAPLVVQRVRTVRWVSRLFGSPLQNF